MPSRSSCSARRSPTPLRNLTGRSSRRAPGLIVGFRADREFGMISAREHGVAVLGRLRQQMLRESLGIERLKVVELLSDAEKPDRQAELAPERRDRATPRAPVQFGDDDAGGFDRLPEQTALLDGVLTHSAVEDEQRLVWRAGQPARHHPNDFA